MLLEKEINDYEKNKDDIIHWINLKGEYRYQTIIDFLKSKSIDLSWENITYYIKYDKRILINSFKYIVFLEELYKSFIKKNKDISQKKLLNYEFKKSLDEYLSIGKEAEYDGIDLELLKLEKKTLNAYRNSVVHNKILLNRTYCRKTLDEVLNIIIKVLPNSYREGFIGDINSCSKDITESLWHIKLEDLANEVI